MAKEKKSVNKKDKNKKPLTRKNVSRRVPNGRTFQTRDEYLLSGKGKKNIKPDHPNPKDLYRRVVAIDSNRFDELVIVKTGTKGRHKLPEYGNGKARYNAFVEIYDDRHKPLKANSRLVENKPSKDLSKAEVIKIKKDVYKNATTSEKLRAQNKKLTRRVKGRK